MRLVTLMLALGMPAVGVSQKPAALHLGPANGSLDENFTRITAVRELHDGRVLVIDPRDRGLVVADLKTGEVESISRKGGGPGEYQSLRNALPLAGDSTLLPAGAGRWLVLHGARVVVTVPPDDKALEASGGSPTGSDRLGHVIAWHIPPPHPGTTVTGKSDSAVAVLVGRKSGEVDTVARLRMPGLRVRMNTDKAGKVTTMDISTRQLDPGEAMQLFEDGWLAVARLDPYRVDWRAPDGSWTRGVPLHAPAVRLDDREKHAQMQRVADETGRPVQAPESVTDWPEVMPPFVTGNTLFAASDGTLVIHRQPTADAPGKRYDVVDRRGHLAGTLSLPANQRIVGFGAKSVYLAFTDDDGLETLHRHPWPPAP